MSENEDLIIKLEKTLSSKFLLEKINDLKSFNDETVIGKNHLADIRDCLIYQLACNNMRRSLEFTTMTLEEFNDAIPKTSPKSGEKHYLVLIKDHKTKDQSRAPMFMNVDEKNLLERFIKFCRPKYTSCQKERCPIFLRRLGSKETCCCGVISVSQINKLITKVYQKANPGERMGTTLMRKIMISFARKLDDSELGHRVIANQANHSVETANRHYDTRDIHDAGLKMLENVLIKRRQALEKHSKDNKVSSWLDENIPNSSNEQNDKTATQDETIPDTSKDDLETAPSLDLTSITHYTKQPEHDLETATSIDLTTVTRYTKHTELDLETTSKDLTLMTPTTKHTEHYKEQSTVKDLTENTPTTIHTHDSGDNESNTTAHNQTQNTDITLEYTDNTENVHNIYDSIRQELLKHKELHKGKIYYDWVKTCNILINTNPRFKNWTRDKIKNKYKYLKRLNDKKK